MLKQSNFAKCEKSRSNRGGGNQTPVKHFAYTLYRHILHALILKLRYNGVIKWVLKRRRIESPSPPKAAMLVLTGKTTLHNN